MGIVTGKNGNGVDVWIPEDLIIVRCGILESELVARMLGMEPTGGGNANNFDATRFFNRGKQDGVGKETSAEYAQFYYTCGFERGRRKDYFAFFFRLCFRIRQQHSQEFFFLLSRNNFIRLCGFRNVKAMSDQRLNLELSLRH